MPDELERKRTENEEMGRGADDVRDRIDDEEEFEDIEDDEDDAADEQEQQDLE